jgi:glycosyltransferase involved in cell wall biosynthesis
MFMDLSTGGGLKGMQIMKKRARISTVIRYTNTMAYRIVHIIGGLDRGGAETMLAKILSRMDREMFTNEVISLTTLGPLATQIQDLGIPVVALGMHQHKFRALGRLLKVLRSKRPHLIQSWNHHSDLLALIGGRLTETRTIFWNIRCSDVMEMGFPRLVKALAWLSPLPTGIIVNSQAGLAVHRHLGYRPKAWHIIGNGFDCALFCPDNDKRQAFRQRYHIPDESILIGMIARFDPMKDHRTFFQAASHFLDTTAHDVRFVLAGQGIHAENAKLQGLIPPRLRENVILCGEDQAVDSIDAALDIAVLCSYRTEGFPNAIGEAMSCGVPCIVTDVGDCRALVGDTGIVIPTQSPVALAKAMSQLIEEGKEQRQQRGQKARAKIMAEYTLETITQAYGILYRQALLKAR